MAGSRSLAQLAEADVDAAWFAEVVALRDRPPRGAGEAAWRLRIFARAEAALAGDRVRETAAVERLVQAGSTEPTLSAWAEVEVGVALRVGPGAAGGHIAAAHARRAAAVDPGPAAWRPDQRLPRDPARGPA